MIRSVIRWSRAALEDDCDGQLGFWSVEERLAEIFAQDDPLETLAATVDFEMFCPVLTEVLGEKPRWKGRRPGFDPVLKFRMLVQSLHLWEAGLGSPPSRASQTQEERLALAYSVAAWRWLVPAFHFTADEGFPDAHDDPQNFDLPS